MRRRTENRTIEFRGSPGGALECVVTLHDGWQYIHRCSEQILRQVAAWLDDHTELVTTTSIADAIDAPLTQVNVALELLKECGMLAPVDGRRSHTPQRLPHRLIRARGDVGFPNSHHLPNPLLNPCPTPSCQSCRRALPYPRAQPISHHWWTGSR